MGLHVASFEILQELHDRLLWILSFVHATQLGTTSNGSFYTQDQSGRFSRIMSSAKTKQNFIEANA